jgi:hypothetical protein
MILACRSAQQDAYSVADAFYDQGVGWVIAATKDLPDVDAVKFARGFYREIAGGTEVRQAFEIAKLLVSNVGARQLRLRERGR